MALVQNNNTSRALERIGTHTDTLVKASKVILSTIDVAFAALAYIPNMLVGREAFEALKTQLKDTGETAGAFSFFERAEWLDAKKRKEILSSPTVKVASRVTLTAGQFLTVISFVDKLSYRFFSLASRCIGVLPILDLVKNLFFVVSSSLNLYSANVDRNRANTTFKKAWIYKNVSKEWLTERKTNKYMPELQKLASQQTRSASDESRKTKLEGYIKVLQQENGADKFLLHKVTAYANRSVNASQVHKKAWAGIVAEIAKLFMITVGTTVACCALAVATLSLPIVTLTIASCGLLTSIIALWKNLYIDVTLAGFVRANELRKGIV